MPALVLYFKFSKYCTYIIKVFKLIILIVKVYKVEHSIKYYTVTKCIYRGSGSSVGIATDYGLDGPGSNPGGDEIFRPSRPVLGPIQPPVKWAPGISRGKIAAGACC